MSRRKTKKRRYTQAQLEAKRVAKKQAKLFALQKNITIFALLIILILGLVSTTFSTSIFATLDDADTGTLIAQVQTAAKSKTDIADTSANVDNADTKANVDTAVTSVDHTGGYVYFLKPSTWTETYVMMLIGHSSYTSVYNMTKVSNTDNLYRYTMPSWSGATYVAFINGSSTWGSGSWGPSNRTNASHYTNVYNNYTFNSGSYYVCVPASTSNDASLSINYKSSVSSLNLTTRANVYSSSNGTSYSSTAAAGTVSVSGYYMSSYSAVSTRSAVSSSSSTAYASTTLAPGSTATFKATANDGYEFVGWSTSTAESGIVSTSATYTYSYDISYTAKTVYALFKKIHTVTYNVNGTKTTEQVAAGDTPQDFPSPSSKTGYTGAWDTNPSGVTITADTTFTYTYTANTYVVTLNGNGATSTGHTTSVTATYASAMPAITVPTRTGYTFTGYWTSSTGTGTQYYTAAGASARTWNKTANTTLYAGWTANTYTVTLNAGGATINSNNVTSYTYGTTTTLPTADDMTYEGYTFNGWYLNSSYTGTAVTEISATTLGNKTYYAQWLSNSLTLSVSKTDTSLDGAQVVVLENGEKVAPSADGTYAISAQSAVNLSVGRPNSDYYISSVILRYGNVQKSYAYRNSDFSEDIISSMETDVTVTYTMAYKPKLTFTGIDDTHIASSSLTYLLDGTTTTLSPAENDSVYVDYKSSVEYSVNLIDDIGAFIETIDGLTTTLNATATKATGTATDITADIAVIPRLTDNKSFRLSFIDNPDLTETSFVYYVGGNEYALNTPANLPYGTPTSVKVIPPQGYFAKIYVDGTTLLDTSEISYSKGSATFDVTVNDADVVYYVQYVKNPTITVTQPQYGSIYVTGTDEDTGETVYYFNGDEVYGGTTLTVHIIPDNSNFTVASVTPADMTKADAGNEWTYQIFADTVTTATITGSATSTDYIATDSANQQASASKYDRVTFTYSATDDDVLSCSVVNTNLNGDKDTIRYSFVDGTLTIVPTTNINDCILVEVKSSATGTVKYYLINLNSFANTEYTELQKIYAIKEAIGITLSGKFSSALKEIGYYISEDNVLFDTLTVDSSTKEDDAYSCSFSQTASGVKYYKVTATDAENNTASVTQKAVFGTDSTVGTKNFYLLNKTDYDISKYSIRICFENESNDRVWASMQSVISDPQYYRATVPTDCNKVSIYLADPDKHLVVKSGEGNFNNVCYYYVEDQIELDSDSKNTIYEMTKFSKTSGMTLQLLQ